MTQFKYFVGIDIASRTFTASVGTMPWKVVLKPQEFENTEDGFQEWLTWLARHQVLPPQTVVCMEATGVYGEALAYFAFAKGYQVAVQPPLEVKRTFKPNVRKTDAVDSLQIAEYAVRYADKLSLWQPANSLWRKTRLTRMVSTPSNANPSRRLLQSRPTCK